MNIETQKKIIEAVMGNAVRSSNRGLAGERNPTPFASVEDFSRDVWLHFTSDTEEQAIAKLMDYCRDWYAAKTKRAEMEFGMEEVA